VYQKSRRRLFIPFVSLPFLLYTLLIFVPLALTVSYSFTNWQGHTLERPFYGLRNYLLLAHDPQVLNAIKNTGMFAIIGALVVFIPAIFISWALTQKIRMKATFRYIIIAPLLLSVVVAGLMWRLLYNPVFGPINNLLNSIGLGALALPWLGDPRTALTAIVIASIWQELGMWVLLISAGLERIPPEILESARVDGANEWQVFWGISLPLLWGVLRLLFILWVILALQVFGQIYVMTPHGTVGAATEVMATLIYTRAFSSSQWGLACAMATLLLIVTLVLSLGMNRLTRYETVEF
jgi:ABC-type sugar transport system permease subunit